VRVAPQLESGVPARCRASTRRCARRYQRLRYTTDVVGGVNPTIGVERLQPFTRWLVEMKLGFIEEFGAGKSDVCVKGLSALAGSIQARQDIYLGWTYWVASPWWADDDFSPLGPKGGEAPQLSARPYLSAAPPRR
jgi:hypothetical protein